MVQEGCCELVDLVGGGVGWGGVGQIVPMIKHAFVFIIFGISIDVHQLQNVPLLLSGGAILAAIYLVRIIYMKIVSRTDFLPELVLVPRGLISILLYYSLPPELKIKGVETGLLFVVVLGTSIVMSLGLFFSRAKEVEGP